MGQANFETLDFSKKIFICASGGRDSSAMALALSDYVHNYEPNYDISLLFGDTHLNRPSSRKTISRLVEVTEFPLVVAKYKGDKRPIDILRESFKQIPRAIERNHFSNKSYKTLFPCCDILKKQPMKALLKTFDKENTIQLLGIKAGDIALHRQYRLRQLREKDTFYRRQKNGLLYYYPLRDCQESDIERILSEHNFKDIKSSGCAICPIFCVADWDYKDLTTARRSRLFAQRLGVDLRAENQLPLSAFCKEGAD